ncbi:MAG: SUMF1/EgtB/PvdO family nonheme iron enzyme [Phycisphaerae bacterium]
MGRYGDGVKGLLLAAIVTAATIPLACSETHQPCLRNTQTNGGDDWLRSMRMARAMLLFDRPWAAEGYARAAILLARDGFGRDEAIALRRRARARTPDPLIEHESYAPYKNFQGRRYAVVARPFRQHPLDANSVTGGVLASCLLQRLRRDRYQPLSRKALPAIMDERDLADARRTAGYPRSRLQAADLLLTGSIDRTDGLWRISAHLVEVDTGRILQSTSAKVDSLRDPERLADELVRPMQLPLKAQPSAPAPRWLQTLLDQAHAMEREERWPLALERYLDCLAIAPDNASVRRAFRRFQDRHGRQLRFELPHAPKQTESKLQRIRVLVGEGVTMELVLLPGEHSLPDAPGVWMQTTEVTQRQYRSVTGHQPSRHVGPDLPVERVSWYDANAFCQALSRKTGLNVRLPSEAMWKRASHAGKRQRRTHRAERPGPRRDPPASNGPVPVRSRAPNGWGLYGLGDNVAEWCRSSSEEAPPLDGPPRVPVRGGSWACPIYQRNPGARRLAGPSGRTSDVGFRVILREAYNQQPERETSGEGS